MQRSSTIKEHPQDKPFPSKWVEPLSSLPFAGRDSVSVPNDPRAFLEWKFGVGAIEQERYPDGSAVDKIV